MKTLLDIQGGFVSGEQINNNAGIKSLIFAILMTRPLDNFWEREAYIFSLPPNEMPYCRYGAKRNSG